ncbi:MAG: hypothetical protein A3E37_03420 [Candidatus Andersenbacteria bacterium RIFCSPHIGHO2_12_FULL_46_9]|nr:MAG: hypothetical protein UW94_C0009G0007 [Parcubacteria group bacterium GW2011_GWA2_45_14]OGY35136.1 MAG: hypothetical protein A3B76_05565 [Candidatus Andersenbacteria bacterium RIFCSPHIGHO2_02_FULL_46_16]OGY37750.1 MAG: hypothetical protein A3E37_03420 [Candidatus Andersenbacteria bacterium RIFCSPHIGHO2_12_FULL_46_9]HBE90038.1 hypothetical protein [Candidatus Andersenbacteria bacterium]
MIYRHASTGNFYLGWTINFPSGCNACLAELQPHKLVWMEQLPTWQEAQQRLEEKAEKELGLEFISSASSLESMPEWEKRTAARI